ncbi:MAG: hypothetical protein KKF08_18970 [Gammaproteobacteria bacterium]|nr:hypothetical protein [Gammaproteobacteria bacterium]
MNTSKIFSRVIDAQEKHQQFLDATQKNISYFLFGKNIDLVKKSTPTTLPIVDILSVINNFNPSPDNPLHNIVSAFTDEISVSDFKTTVKPYPVEGKEPYDSYADTLESYLGKIHRESRRRTYMKAISFEMLCHGYFGIYFDGLRYYFLTAYDLIPGDKGVLEPEMQPFWIRKTQANRAVLQKCGVDPTTETAIFGTLDELEMFAVYDVYVKSQDLNIGFTQSGKVLYNQPMRAPKNYPLFVANTSELINSFYPVPIMSALVQKLKDFQDAQASIKESSSSIAKPILVYDDDAGIDVNKLLTALKQGYKHVIVGKNREGDINFKAPGQLPAYAQMLPSQIEEDIMKDLGLNKAFMGFASQGARERGALARLIKTSFRRLASLSGLIEDVFTDLDKYIIDYTQAHRISLHNNVGFDIEEIFGGSVTYVPSERFTAYSTEDSYENKMFIMNQWRSKLMPSIDALEQLGDNQPKKTLGKIKQEALDQQVTMIENQKKAMSQQNLSMFDIVSGKLNAQLKFRYYLSPLSGNKMLVKVSVADAKMAAFMLADMTNDVMIEPTLDFEEKPLEQDNPAPPLPPAPVYPTVDQTSQPITESPIPAAPAVPGEPTGETRGRPATATPEAVVPNAPQDLRSGSTASQELKQEPTPVPTELVAPVVTEGFNPDEINTYLSKTKVLYDIEKYKDLPAMYIVEPHAKWIYLGRKMALVMATDSPEALNKPMLFAGKQVYGVIILRKIISEFDFKATQKYHLVNDRERMRWWGDKPVYMYLFEFFPFKYPESYVKVPGIQTFIPHIEIISDSEIPEEIKQE